MSGLSRLVLEAIAKGIPVGVVVVEKDGKIAYANERAIQLLGFELEGRKLTEYTGAGLKLLTLNGELYPVEGIPASIALIEGKESRVEMIVERADGSRIVVSTSATPIRNESGEVTASVSIFDDITEHKVAEEELEENKETLELAQRVARLGSWQFFVKEDRAVWSKEMFSIFKLSTKAAPNITAYSKMIHPDDLSMVRKVMDGLLANGKLGETVNFDYRIVRPDGSIRFLHSGRMVTEVDDSGKVSSLVGIEQDITERKDYETSLSDSEERFRLVAEAAKVLVYEISEPQHDIAIHRGEDVLGYASGEIPTKADWWISQIHPQDREETLRRLRRAMDEGVDYSLEYRIKRKQGDYIFAHDTGKAVKDKEGKLVRFLGGMRDVTERRKWEQGIKLSEARFRSVYENSLDAILLTIPNGTILSANPSAQRMFGMTEDEIKSAGRNGLTVMDKRLETAVDARAKTGKAHAELTFRRKDGSTFEGDITSSLFVDVDGVTKTSMIIRDITERKQQEMALLESRQKLEEQSIKLEEYASGMEQLAEERARQLQDALRLAAIGTTAGMVGHDIRNPLQAITGDLYLLKDNLSAITESETKKEMMESLDEIQKNVGYINKIVADLQDYARPLIPECKFVNLTEIVRETLKVVDVPDNVKVTNETDHIELRTDPQFIRRALTNLINNAVQAMANGGNLVIEACEVYQKKNESKVIITVADTGAGIPDEFARALKCLLLCLLLRRRVRAWV